MKTNNYEASRLARYIHNWLNEYTPSIKANSPHTIKSHYQALSLYLLFLEVVMEVVPANFHSGCFSRSNVETWIIWLKEKRQNKPESCNVRLASLKSFLKYLASRDVSFLYLYTEANEIPPQKILKRKVSGLSRDAIKALMSIPDIGTKTGRRDLTLMIVMYNTAVRIDELLSLKMENLHLDIDKPYITVIGKGRKIRTLYLLPRSVEHLRKYIKEFHGEHPNSGAYVFYSRNTGIMGKMSQEAINKQLKKYAILAKTICNDVPLAIHAHRFRHAKATHWLEDGMNIVQVSFMLGHSNIQTTMEYIDITTEQEERALATLENETQSTISKNWKPNINALLAYCGLQ